MDLVYYLLTYKCFFKFLLSLYIYADSFQNTTIEERVSLLEFQIAEIEEDVTTLGVGLEGLGENVDFLFDERVIQDERIYNLEQTSIEIDEEVEGHYPFD